ncbi:MAG: oxygenase MpaB family protein [Acidimicrobiales bacterium]
MSGDPGLFGSDSVTWRIHANPAGLLGGGRALLVQALHPTTMAVFDQNTAYEADPWGRLWRTADWFSTVTFGDTASAEMAGAQLRAVHGRLQGIDPLTGANHRADEVDLLLWVHATAIHSFLTAYRRYGGRLSDPEADRYVAETVRIAELVGLAASDVPANLGDLRDYLKGMHGRLAVTPAARKGMEMVLMFPPVPLAARPLWPVVSAAVISLLPRRVRALYGLPWHPMADPPVRVVGFSLSRLFGLVLPRITQLSPPLDHARRAA